MHTRANITITIRVGNAAVQDGDDVSGLLEQAATRFTRHGRFVEGGDLRHAIGNLIDTNGNTVGYVQITDFEQTPESDEEAVAAYPDRYDEED